VEAILKPLDLLEEQAGAGTWLPCSGPWISAFSPTDGRQIGVIRSAGRDDCTAVIFRAVEAFKTWRSVPAPRRGEIVRQIGEALRLRKKELGALVGLETGKIRAESEGEVQEMIDIADFALGQSRMLTV
jgi:aldehyde dehydrogenase (NAD+)